MEKVFLISVIITFLFCVLKFIEMKYLDKDYYYSIAVWDTSWASVIECKDKRLRLVK